jgi:hypothetical protein
MQTIMRSIDFMFFIRVIRVIRGQGLRRNDLDTPYVIKEGYRAIQRGNPSRGYVRSPLTRLAG